jgi:hypothetical protein
MEKIMIQIPEKTYSNYKKILHKFKNDGISHTQVHRAVIDAGCEMNENDLRSRIAENIKK